MESLILNHPESWRFAAYAIIFAALFIEGEAVIFIAFYLVHQGYLDFFDTTFFVLSGVFLNDVFWYYLGSFAIGEKLPFLRHISRFISVIDANLKRNPILTLVVSKFAYGFYRLTLMRTRYSGISLKNFIKINFSISLIWIILIMGLSYALSESILYFKEYIKFAETGLALAIFIFILASVAISRFSEKTLQERLKNQQNYM